MSARPLIVGLGGTTRPDSTSETALRLALAAAERLGARTACLTGPEIDLPHYDPAQEGRCDRARRLVALLREADGVILSSPAYHGGPSGMIKNALDYTEDMRDDARPYLDERAVGLIVAAYGAQAMGTTLTSLRSVVHALRGWPTPLAITLDGQEGPFRDGQPATDALAGQFEILARQLVGFAARSVGARDRGRAEEDRTG